MTSLGLVVAAFFFIGEPPITDTEWGIWKVETNLRTGAIKGRHGENGCLQISRAAFIDSRVEGGYERTAELGFSIEVFRAYIKRWCSKKRLGREATLRDICYCWNGGAGFQRASKAKRQRLETYYQKVKRAIEGRRE